MSYVPYWGCAVRLCPDGVGQGRMYAVVESPDETGPQIGNPESGMVRSESVADRFEQVPVLPLVEPTSVAGEPSVGQLFAGEGEHCTCGDRLSQESFYGIFIGGFGSVPVPPFLLCVGCESMSFVLDGIDESAALSLSVYDDAGQSRVGGVYSDFITECDGTHGFRAGFEPMSVQGQIDREAGHPFRSRETEYPENSLVSVHSGQRYDTRCDTVADRLAAPDDAGAVLFEKSVEQSGRFVPQFDLLPVLWGKIRFLRDALRVFHLVFHTLGLYCFVNNKG